MFMYDYPILPPSGTDLGSVSITRVNVMDFGAGPGDEITLTLAQSAHLAEIFDLGHKALILTDISMDQVNGWGMMVSTQTGQVMEFRFDETTKSIFIIVDYNEQLGGKTYYAYDDIDGHAYMEATYYIGSIYRTQTADPKLTYTSYYLGSILDYSDPSKIPYKTFSAAQLTKIQTLLQLNAWKLINPMFGTIPDSEFVLRISDSSHLDFRRIGSMVVASLNTGESYYFAEYLIPLSAYEDTLAYLKTLGN